MKKTRKTPKNRLYIVAACVLVVGAGLISLALTGAAGAYISTEPESGTLSHGAVVTSDLQASGAKSITFKSTGTPPPSGAGLWWSGQSDAATTKNGSFAAWRGRPVEVGGFWAATTDVKNAVDSPQWSLLPGTSYGSITHMDWAIGGMLDNSGESWSKAASGSYDARWASQLKALKTGWGSRAAGDMYIRFAHEFNGNWYPWSVSTGDVGNFKTAWKRFHAQVQANFPGAKVVWCPNDESSWSYDIRTLYPGDDVVDIVAVDAYNNWPWTTTAAEFTAKASRLSAQGGPTGVESFRKFAELHGKPMAVSEWSNSGVANAGGGGESPAFMQSFHDWLAAHGSRTPAAGKVLYEVLFNVVGYDDHYTLYPESAESGNTSTAAKYREIWKL